MITSVFYPKNHFKRCRKRSRKTFGFLTSFLLVFYHFLDPLGSPFGAPNHPKMRPLQPREPLWSLPETIWPKMESSKNTIICVRTAHGPACWHRLFWNLSLQNRSKMPPGSAHKTNTKKSISKKCPNGARMGFETDPKVHRTPS